jgi:site-specific DNA recombinase
LAAERRGLGRDLARWDAEIRALAASGAGKAATPDISRLTDLHERSRLAERRAAEIDNEVAALGGGAVTQEEVERALAAFDTLWDSLTPGEQARIVHLLVERIDYDGSANKLSITFHPSGIKTLADELAGHPQERSA